MTKCYILKNTNNIIFHNYLVLLQNENELIEYLKGCSDVHLITYDEPNADETYYNINGDLIKGDFSPINDDCEEM